MSRLSVTEQVTKYCKDNIILGNWALEEKIPSEKQLTETLGVSRASVRTAIQQLVGLGILKTIHGKGTYLITDQIDSVLKSEIMVTKEDCENILKVVEFRTIVEPEACYMAVLAKKPELVPNLERLLRVMIQKKDNGEEFVTIDIAFHKEICRVSGNPLIEKIMNQVFDEYRKRHDQINKVHGCRDGIFYHTLLVEAIREENAIRARDIMTEHLQRAIDQLKK